MKATWDAQDLPTLQARANDVVEKRKAESDTAYLPVKAAIEKHKARPWFVRWLFKEPMTGWCNNTPEEVEYMWARSALYDAKSVQARINHAMAICATSITLDSRELDLLHKWLPPTSTS